MNTYIVLFITLVLLIFRSSCTCDSQVDKSLKDIGYYVQNGFSTKNYDSLAFWLGQLGLFDMKGVYQQCLNKTITDPTVAFPRNESECLTALYQVYWLAGNYSSNPTKFKQDAEKIGKIVFSSYSACHNVLSLYTPPPNSDCIQHIKDNKNTYGNYLDDLDMGGNGTKYINQIFAIASQQRRICDVNTTFQTPIPIKGDNCNQASRQFLYPQIDSLVSKISKQNYKVYTQNLYLLYQLAYRANIACNKNFLDTKSFSMKNHLTKQGKIVQHYLFQQ